MIREPSRRYDAIHEATHQDYLKPVARDQQPWTRRFERVAIIAAIVGLLAWSFAPTTPTVTASRTRAEVRSNG